MAAEFESVHYSYSGDAQSLEKATRKAISALDAYEKKLQKVNTQAVASSTADDYADALDKISRRIGGIAHATKGIDFSKLGKDTKYVQLLQNALQHLDRSLKSLGKSPKTKDLEKVFGDLTNATHFLQQVERKMFAHLSTQDKVKEIDNVTFSLKDCVAAMTMLRRAQRSMGLPASVINPYFSGGKITGAKGLPKRERSAVPEPPIDIADTQPVPPAPKKRGRPPKKQSDVPSSSKTTMPSPSDVPTKEYSTTKRKKKYDNGGDHVGADAWKNTAKDSKDTADNVDKVGKGVTRVNDRMNFLERLMNRLRYATISFIGQGIGDLLGQSINRITDYIEVLNLFKVSMGESSEEADKFAEAMEEGYGMDISNISRYTGEFKMLADAIDMPEQAAYNMSTSLTQLGADISSLYNVSLDQVMSDLASGMQGMTKAVRKYGMDLRVTTLQETASSLGIKEKVRNMNEASREALRYITINRQMIKAHGDFAATIETPANQIKILREQLSILSRTIGSLFIGSVSSALPYLVGFTMALRRAVEDLQSLFGYKLPDQRSNVQGNADAMDGLGDATDDVLKKQKKLTASIDELNILNSGDEDKDPGTVDPKLLDEMNKYKADLADIDMKAKGISDNIYDWFVKFGWVFKILGAIASLFLAVKLLSTAFKIGKGIANFFKELKAVKNLKDVMDLLTGKTKRLSKEMQKKNDKLDAQTKKTNKDATAAKGLKNVFTKLGDATKGLGNKLTTLGSAAGNAAKNGLSKITSVFTSWPGKIGTIGTLITWLMSKFNTLAAEDPTFTLTPQVDATPAVQSLQQYETASNGILQNMFTQQSVPAVDTGGAISSLTQYGSMASGIGSNVSSIFSSMSSGVSSALNGVSSSLQSTSAEANNMAQNVNNAASSTSMATNIMSQGVQSAMGSASSSASSFASSFGQAMANVQSSAMSTISTIQNLISTLGQLSGASSSTSMSGGSSGGGGSFGSNLMNGLSDINWLSGGPMPWNDNDPGNGGGKTDTAYEDIENIIYQLNAERDFKDAMKFDTGGSDLGWWATAIAGASAAAQGVGAFAGSAANAVGGAFTGFIPQWLLDFYSQGFDYGPIASTGGNFSGNFATGGFPTRGDLFVANETVPEMVGNMGNKTAVANNTQIVTAVSRGVSEAVAQVMGSGGGSKGSTVLKVDSREIARANTSGNNKARFSTVSTGGFER